VPPGIAIIEGDRPYGVLVASEQPVFAINPSHVRGKRQAKPQESSGRRVFGIGLDRPLECADRGLMVRARQPPSMRLTASHELPSTNVV
jgi:hypothetical protein